jgi:hypothetical protein
MLAMTWFNKVVLPEPDGALKIRSFPFIVVFIAAGYSGYWLLAALTEVRGFSSFLLPEARGQKPKAITKYYKLALLSSPTRPSS